MRSSLRLGIRTKPIWFALAWLVALGLGFADPVRADEPERNLLVGTLLIENPRLILDAADPTKANLVFLANNRGAAPDTLQSVSAEHAGQGGALPLGLPANKVITLGQGDVPAIPMEGFDQPLQAGQTLSIRLMFTQSGPLDTTVNVSGPQPGK